MSQQFFKITLINPLKMTQSGFSLLDIFSGTIIVSIVGTIALYNLLENPESRKIRLPAERNLKAFVDSNQLNVVKCIGQDTDNDGWVNCQATDRQGQTVKLICGYDNRQQTCQKEKM